VFRCTSRAGKIQDFRVRQSINESGIGGGVSAWLPTVLRRGRVQFADYIYPAYDPLSGARIRYRSNGDFTVPTTIPHLAAAVSMVVRRIAKAPEALLPSSGPQSHHPLQSLTTQKDC
jgi:pyruvate/2-oxoglutarate/acetoin dehydrogenase E1 component